MGKLQGALISDKPSIVWMLVFLGHPLSAMRPRHLVALEEAEEAVAYLAKSPAGNEMMVGVLLWLGD